MERRRERHFYDRLETKPLGEQQKIIRSERNTNRRPGIKILVRERIGEYSEHFATMFNFREEFIYDQVLPPPINRLYRSESKDQCDK